MQTVGIIGTGEIGWRMGKLLIAAGHTVVGYDIEPAALRRPKESGFSIADNVASLCRDADVVITCVTDGAGLTGVVKGSGGLLESMRPGCALIDTTSAEPWITRGLAPLLAERKIPFLDAPVSGGVPAAEAGRMNFMVGGDQALLERCCPLLERLGPVVTYVGPTGSGHTIKAINMLALAASMLAAAEVLAVGLRNGLALGQLIDVLDSGEGASYSTRVHYPRFIEPGNFGSGFTFDLMLKDLSIGIGLADRLGVPLYLERSTFELYRAAANAGMGGKDNTRMVESVLLSGRPSGPPPRSETMDAQLTALASAANRVVAAEALCLGQAAGLAPETVIAVLAASSGDSYMLSKSIPAYLNGARDNYETLAHAWMKLAGGLGSIAACVVAAPLISQAAAVHAAALQRHGPEADPRRVVDLLAAWTAQGSVVDRSNTQGDKS